MPVVATGAIFGDAAGQLAQAIDRLSRTRPLVTEMAAQAAISQRQNIDERHAPDGTPYDVLSPTTLALRGLSPHFTPAAGGRGARLTYRGDHPNGDAPLKDTGRMYDSIHFEVFSDGEAWAGPHALDAWYFAFQNQGTERRGNWRAGESVSPGIPARPFIGISEPLYLLWFEDVAEFVRSAFSFVGSAFE